MVDLIFGYSKAPSIEGAFFMRKVVSICFKISEQIISF